LERGESILNSLTTNIQIKPKAVLELLLGAFIVYFYLWCIFPEYEIWKHILFYLIFIGLLFYSKHSRKDSFKDLGLGVDYWIPSFKMLLTIFVPAGIVLFVIWSAIFPVNLDFYKQAKFWKRLVTYPIWALIQQYVFLAFFFRRLRDILSPHYWIAIFCSAVLFSAVHIPNYPLLILSFLGGLIWSWIYHRYNNLITIAFLHGILGTFCLTLLLMYLVVGPYADAGRWTRALPAYSTIDSINMIKVNIKNSPIDIKRSTGYITVRGWAAGKRSEINKIYIRLDKEDYLCKYGFKREDVAAAYNNSTYTYSGYFVKIPIVDIKPGYYFIKLKIQLKDHRYFHYPSKKVWIKIIQ